MPPGGTGFFDVRFIPLVAGVRSATLTLPSNDPGGPFVIELTGTGLSPLAIAQQAYLKASNTGADDWFGSAVAVSGNTVVVGAPFEGSSATGVNGNQDDNSAVRAGAVYVFTFDGESWEQEAYLKASNTDPDDRFGQTVAISGDTIVVGAYFEDGGAAGVGANQNDNSAGNAGAAYVFV
ncbi:MAG: integrin, partial [Akkermansiaceae bacterium]|nr:integrin [Akkermansiaceae bacterium]